MSRSSSLCLYSSNLGTFWLKIKQFWPFEELSIFSNGVHLGWRAWLSEIIFKGNPIRMIQAKYGLNWPSGFSGKHFWKSLQTNDGRQVMAIAHTGELKTWWTRVTHMLLVAEFHYVYTHCEYSQTCFKRHLYITNRCLKGQSHFFH
jgi:hypothetical protein